MYFYITNEKLTKRETYTSVYTIETSKKRARASMCLSMCMQEAE